MAQLNSIKRKNSIKDKKRVGRGGRRGTYSGRGQKGQKSRAGRRIRPVLRDIIKRIPKKRGYRFHSIKEKPAVVSLALLETKFASGAEVSPVSLYKAGLVSRKSGHLPVVKILGSGGITKKITVKGCLISSQAAEAVKKAGGNIAGEKAVVESKPAKQNNLEQKSKKQEKLKENKVVKKTVNKK
jgi:large subunit ribosomal protein L15